MRCAARSSCSTAHQEQLLREHERDLHALAVAVAEKILQREVTTDPSIVLDLVRKALELLPADTTLEIHQTADMQALQKSTSARSRRRAACARLERRPDTPGNFVMENRSA